MNISEKKLENARIELQIEVPVEKVSLEYKSVFDKIQQKAVVDGFRKGKAPLPMIETKFKERADMEVAENLLKSSFFEAVTEKQLRPIAAPEYSFDSILREAPFTFKAVFDIAPSTELGKYRELPAEEQPCIISDSDVEYEISSMRERDAQVDPKGADAMVESGDLVKLKVRRTDDVSENELESVEFKEYSIIVGKSKDESALDKQITGMKAGEERMVEVKYPKDYQMKDLAGQKVKYQVKIEELSTMTLPEVTDEFAKKFGYESVENMRKVSRDNLEKYTGNKSRGDVKAALLKQVIENATFDVPETIVLNEMAVIFNKTRERVGFMTDSLEEFASAIGQDPDQFRERLRTEANQSVRASLALSEIAKKEELKYDENEYKDVLNQLAQRFGKSPEETETLMIENGMKSKIELDLLLNRALDFIYENAKIKKHKPVSLDEFLTVDR